MRMSTILATACIALGLPNLATAGDEDHSVLAHIHCPQAWLQLEAISNDARQTTLRNQVDFVVECTELAIVCFIRGETHQIGCTGNQAPFSRFEGDWKIVEVMTTYDVYVAAGNGNPLRYLQKIRGSE